MAKIHHGQQHQQGKQDKALFFCDDPMELWVTLEEFSRIQKIMTRGGAWGGASSVALPLMPFGQSYCWHCTRYLFNLQSCLISDTSTQVWTGDKHDAGAFATRYTHGRHTDDAGDPSALTPATLVCAVQETPGMMIGGGAVKAELYQ